MIKEISTGGSKNQHETGMMPTMKQQLGTPTTDHSVIKVNLWGKVNQQG